MTYLSTVAATACAALLFLPGDASAQTTSRAQDSMRVRDSLATVRQVRRDSIAAARRSNSMNQPPATSQERMRVRKDVRGESNGTLDMPRVTREDSIAAAEARRREEMERAAMVTRDSLANVERMRLDAIAREERARLDALAAAETARRDSVARAEALMEQERIRRQEMQRQYRFRGTGFYAGVAAGLVKPTGNLENLGYNSGANVNLPIGYHKQNQVLGVRLDLGYAQFRGEDFRGNLPDGATLQLSNNNVKVLSATANITAHLPLTASKKLQVYGLTGAGIYQFRSFGNTSALGGFLGNNVLQSNTAEFQSVRNKLGAQFGAGLEYAIGPAAIFVESRITNIFANRAKNVELEDYFGANRGQNVRWIPLMIGMNFR